MIVCDKFFFREVFEWYLVKGLDLWKLDYFGWVFYEGVIVNLFLWKIFLIIWKKVGRILFYWKVKFNFYLVVMK